MPVLAARYPTAQTTAGSTWTNAANAVGSTANNFATLTMATNGGTGSILLSGYGIAAAIPAGATITAITVTVKSYVGATAAWSSVRAQLFAGASTAIGTFQSLTLTNSTSNSQAVTFTGTNLPTTAQLSDLRVRILGTHAANTTSSTMNVDLVSMAVTYSLPKLADAVDPFDTLSTSMWAAGAGVSVAGGQLVQSCNASYTGDQTSQASYDFTDSSAAIELVQAPVLGNGSTETYFSVVFPTGDTFFFDQNGPVLRAVAWTNGGATQADVVSLPYSPAQHRWWRLRHASGTVFYEVSQNGKAWSVYAQTATALDTSSVKLNIGTGHYGTETAPGNAIWDNLNVAAPSVRQLRAGGEIVIDVRIGTVQPIAVYLGSTLVWEP